MTTEIPIQNIKVLRNIRTEIGDVSELMEDIKKNGLMHPIGIWKDKNEKSDVYFILYGHRRFQALKKLGRKRLEIGKELKLYPSTLSMEDVIVMNISENIHRLENSPLEFAKACQDLKDLGLSIGEIAVRISQNKQKVQTALKVMSYAPEDVKNLIGFVDRSTNKNGKVSITTANVILGMRINKKDITSLFDYARKEELSANDMRFLGRVMLEKKISLQDALKIQKEYVCKTIHLFVKKELLNEIKQGFNVYTIDVLKGKRKQIDGLVL